MVTNKPKKIKEPKTKINTKKPKDSKSQYANTKQSLSKTKTELSGYSKFGFIGDNKEKAFNELKLTPLKSRKQSAWIKENENSFTFTLGKEKYRIQKGSKKMGLLEELIDPHGRIKDFDLFRDVASGSFMEKAQSYKNRLTRISIGILSNKEFNTKELEGYRQFIKGMSVYDFYSFYIRNKDFFFSLNFKYEEFKKDKMSYYKDVIYEDMEELISNINFKGNEKEKFFTIMDKLGL